MTGQTIAGALVAALLTLGPAHAETGTLGSMTVMLPDPQAGWTRSTSADGVLLRKALPPERGTGAGGAIIAIYRPAAPQGPFDQAFARFARLDALPDERPLQHAEGVTINGHPMAWAQRCCRARNGVSAEAHFIGIDAPRTASGGGRVFLMLAAIGTGPDQAEPLVSEFAAIVRSVQPAAGDRPFAIAPADRAAGLDGLYTTLRTGLRPNAFGGLDFYSESDITLFDPGGIYARVLPHGEQSVATLCTATPQQCGWYRMTADTPPHLVLDAVENRFGMIRREEAPLTRDGDDLTFGNQALRHVAPFAEDARLEGSWRYVFASSGATAFSSGSVSVERVLTLGRDGRFSRSGYAGITSTNEIGDARAGVTAAGPRRAETGRYRIGGTRLTLTDDDGRITTSSVFRPDPGSDGLLIIDGANYLKSDKH